MYLFTILLQGQSWPGVLVPTWDQSVDQIELSENYLYWIGIPETI